MGDLNSDGQRDVADLLLMQRALTTGPPPTGIEFDQADIAPTGGDDNLDVADLVEMQQLVAP